MSLLKNFCIQWGWLLKKRGMGTALLIAGFILLFAFLGAVVFMLGFVHNQEGERIISNNSIQIIGGISALVLFYLYFMATEYASLSKNFKIAINEAEKFVAENPQCRSRINILIEETRGTKSPAKLNEWINDWERFSSAKANLQELEKEKEDIEKGISLDKVSVEIKARKKKIRELESKLA